MVSEGDEDTGHVGAQLEAMGARQRSVWRDQPRGWPVDLDRIDLVVLMGSDASVADVGRARAVAAEIDLVGAAERSGRAVLGICYGAQLLAAAHGARVGPARRPEVGWQTISTADPELAPPGPWFQFHRDRWWSGAGLDALAWSEVGPQTLHHGRSVGWQFHPEVTTTIIERWLSGPSPLIGRAGVDPAALLERSVAVAPAAAASCRRLVERVVERVVGAGPTAAVGAPALRCGRLGE